MPALPPPAESTPDDRFREIAAILARGVLRLRARHLRAADFSSTDSPEFVPDGLEVPRDPRLSVHSG